MLATITSLALLGLAAGALDSRRSPTGDVPPRLRSRHLKVSGPQHAHRRADTPNVPMAESQIVIMGPNGGVMVTGVAPDEDVEVFEPNEPADGDDDDSIPADVGTVEPTDGSQLSLGTPVPTASEQDITDSSLSDLDSFTTYVQEFSTQPDIISIELPDTSIQDKLIQTTPAPEALIYYEDETAPDTGMFNTAQGQNDIQVDTTSTGIFSTAQSQAEIDAIAFGRYSTGIE